MKAQKYGAALGSHGVSGGRFGELKNPASKGARRTEKAQEASDISHDSSNEEKLVKRRGIHPLIAGLVGDQAKNDNQSSENDGEYSEEMNLNLKDAKLMTLPIFIAKWMRRGR